MNVTEEMPKRRQAYYAGGTLIARLRMAFECAMPRDWIPEEDLNMKTKLFLMLAVLGILFVATTVANADSLYFAQDDFTLTFAAPNNPSMPGSTFVSTGRIVDWTNLNIIDGWFTITGTGLAGSVVGGEYVTPYSASMNIYSDAARTILVWAGTGGSLVTDVKLGAPDPFLPSDAYSYLATNYFRPSGVTNPDYFKSAGSGVFTGAGSFDTATTFYMPWFGTFNWDYTNNPLGEKITQIGNLQGELTDTVPEPATILLFGFGLSVLGLGARFRNR